MDYLTSSFAPLILLAPVLIALALAIFFTYRLSARIAQRNAEEEQNRPRLKTQADSERDAIFSLAEDEPEVVGKLIDGDRDIINRLGEEDKAELRKLVHKAEAMSENRSPLREKDGETPDVKSHGKSA